MSNILLSNDCIQKEVAFPHATETAEPSLTVDLRSPEYSDGVLKTDQGGVISAEGLRLQARSIVYQRKVIEGLTECKVEAEGDLILEFNERTFIGRRLEYDFENKMGVIYGGKTAILPWFFGGERIFLHADGSYTIENSFITTSENCNMDWKLSAQKALLLPDRTLYVKNIQFQYYNTPLLHLPSIKANVDSMSDFPIRCYARLGGRQGPRIKFIYKLFSWNRWKTFLRFDYRLTRGPGLGMESYYLSEDHKEVLEMINYLARDSSLDNPHEKYRYRFQGRYANSYFDDQVTVHLTYDKLSDKDMATDYRDNGIDLEYVGATQLRLRRQANHWIANCLTAVRINPFQTIMQELPTFEVSWKPFHIGSSQIISNTIIKASFLNFTYAHEIHHYEDFHSSRLQYLQQFYRPFHLGNVTITPECGGTLIYYGNLPKNNERWLTLGTFKLEVKAPFYKKYYFGTHTIIPYTYYQYYSMPTSQPHEHFIFSIEDGLYQLNLLRFGLQQNFCFTNAKGFLSRPLKLDIFANAFINTPTVPRTIQKAYANLTLFSSPTLCHTVSTAWDFEENLVDHFNFRSEWTVSENTAIAAEFRHRDAFAFRKADPTNFILDAYKSQQRLEHSALSDRRDTFLLHFFCRFTPLWAVESKLRHGWNRKHQPNYTEFEVDLIGKPYTAWVIRFSYQHRENDRHRFTVYFNMDVAQPDEWKCGHFVPSLAF